MADKFKVGDKVKVAKNAPQMYIAGVSFIFTEIASTVTKIDYPENNPEDQTLRIEITPFNFMEIPSIYVERVENEEQNEAEEDARIRQMEAELDEFRKAELDRVLHPEKYHTYEVTIDNVAVDWQRYEADLAKEIAVKLSKPNENKPGYVADYAVSVAKAVVENLKRSDNAPNLNPHKRQRRTLGENGQDVRYHGVPPPRLHQRAAAQGCGLPSV